MRRAQGSTQGSTPGSTPGSAEGTAAVTGICGESGLAGWWAGAQGSDATA